MCSGISKATPFGSTKRHQWQELIGSNLSGPFFLCQALAAELTHRRGAIINLVDVHSDRGLKGYATYSIAKAGTELSLVEKGETQLASARQLNAAFRPLHAEAKRLKQ